MKPRFSYQPIALALFATLMLAGLFYLPYLSVRTKTIDSFHRQQRLLAQQAGSGIQSYFTTYEKALTYLVGQPSIQWMDESGKALLQDFFSIHPEDIDSIQRISATGGILFSTPRIPGGQVEEPGYCGQAKEQRMPSVSDFMHLANGQERIFFYAPVMHADSYEGCLAFSVPYARIAGRVLESIPHHQEGAVLMFSQEGIILHAPDSSLIGKNLDHLGAKADDLLQLRIKLKQQEQGLLALSGDLAAGAGQLEKKLYAVVYPVELPGKTTWSIVLVTPAKDVLGAMAEFRSQWLLVTGVAILAVGLLSFFLSGAVAKRREEQRQRAMEEQMASLLELAPMGVFLIGADETVVYANREAVRMVTGDRGVESPVVGRSLVEFIQGESRGEVAAKLRQVVSGLELRLESVQFPASAGRLREVEVTAACHGPADKHQCIVILRDVTEARRAEEGQRRLAAAIDQVKEAVLIVDDSGIVEYVNVALGEMTGYRREECIGQAMDILWAKEQDAHFDRKFEEVIVRGEVWKGRIVNQRKDGSLFVAAATASPVRDAGGRTSHFVVVQRDITHEMEVESRMRQAQKMEAIGTLAGGIAHDFNNILGGIIGFTDMALLQCQPDSELYSNLLHIRQGGRRAADLVQQILTFSRQSVEEKVPVLVAPLIKESLKLLRASLPSTIEIVLEIIATDVLVLAAPVQIQQIVMNLCANAFYSMREKGGRLTLGLERLEITEGSESDVRPRGNWVALVVKDTGQGMESEVLPRIFTPFFTTKQPGEGTGMGLSVVHGIVRELGGVISVQSEVGQGSTFTVLLPIAEKRGNSNLFSSEAPLPTGDEHILVVDDEKEIRETCRMMLSHLGYTITTASDPREVRAMIEQAHPRIDLVITDQTMPKMTGVQLTRELRQLFPDIPVILCTGFSDRLNTDIAREAGACDLLMKPVDLRGLSEAVRAALDLNW